MKEGSGFWSEGGFLALVQEGGGVEGRWAFT